MRKRARPTYPNQQKLGCRKSDKKNKGPGGNGIAALIMYVGQ